MLLSKIAPKGNRRSETVVLGPSPLLALVFVTNGLATSLKLVTPEQVGLSSERLLRLERVMKEEVDRKRKAGIITLVARHGKIAYLKVYGFADMESGRPPLG